MAELTETKWRWLEQVQFISFSCKVWVGRWSRELQHLCFLYSHPGSQVPSPHVWSSWGWSRLAHFPISPIHPLYTSTSYKGREKEWTSAFQEHSPEDSHTNSIQPLAETRSHDNRCYKEGWEIYSLWERAIYPVQSR